MVGEGCGRKNAAGSRASPRSSRAGTMRETCRISARRVRFFSPKAARFSSSCDISGRSDFRIQVQDRGRILFCGAGSPWPGLLRRSARKGRGKLAFFCGGVAGQGCCGMVGCGRDFSAAPPRRQRKRFSAQTVAEGGIFQSVGLYRQKKEGLTESHAFHEAFASSLVSPTGFEPVLEA